MMHLNFTKLPPFPNATPEKLKHKSNFTNPQKLSCYPKNLHSIKIQTRVYTIAWFEISLSINGYLLSEKGL